MKTQGFAALLSLSLSIAGLAACASTTGEADEATSDALSVKGVTKAERDQYLASAKIWSDPNPADDLLTGPRGADSFPATRNADGTATIPSITCEFIEPTTKNELGGLSPKFQCGACKDGCNVDKTLKVKFGQTADSNGEIYGEVMATRLFRAVGLKTDDVYPVRVTCKNCPPDPWAVYHDFTPGAGARADRVYTAALIERKYDGKKIEIDSWPADKDGEGFSFDEVEKDRTKMANRGASEPEWSAFKLLAAFIKHSDNKAANQRLVCATGAIDAQAHCTSPFLMIQDPGSTFGGGGGILGTTNSDTKARYEEWSEKDVWRDRSACQAALFSFYYTDPVVSEGGRQLLARRLAALTDTQLHDIFTASRITERGETLKDHGTVRAVTVDDWVAAFKEKRDELSKPCGG